MNQPRLFRRVIAVDPGFVNIGVVIWEEGTITDIRLINVKHEKQSSSKGQKIDTEKFRREMNDLLDVMSANPEDTLMVIENQGACGPFQLATLQVAFSFELWFGEKATVLKVQAANRFNLIKDHVPSKDYTVNKKTSIAYADAWMLSYDAEAKISPELRAMYQAMRKRDDVADALMMVLAYLGRAKTMKPEIHNRKKGPKSKEGRALKAQQDAQEALDQPEAFAKKKQKSDDKSARLAVNKAARVQAAVALEAQKAVEVAIARAAETAQAATAAAARAAEVTAAKAQDRKVKGKAARLTAKAKRQFIDLC